MNEDEEEYWQTPSDGTDDGLGPFDGSEGCSYCGFWQCDGTSCN